jgi:hypothetical protein
VVAGITFVVIEIVVILGADLPKGRETLLALGSRYQRAPGTKFEPASEIYQFWR